MPTIEEQCKEMFDTLAGKSDAVTDDFSVNLSMGKTIASLDFTVYLMKKIKDLEARIVELEKV